MSARRTEFAVKNTLTSLLYQGFILLAGLVSRAVFVTVFSKDYLGASSLFNSVLSVLSLAEMGMGTAIIQKLYKPLEERDEAKIGSLMHVFQKVYFAIGGFILLAGLIIMPFAPTFVKQVPEGLSLEGVYLMCLLQTASSYLFVHNRSLLSADQRSYKTIGIDFAFRAVIYVAQILLMLLTKNYYLYFGVGILLERVDDAVVSIVIRRKYYPFLRGSRAEPLPDGEKRQLRKDVMALMIYKFSSVSIGSTDTIIVSKMFGTGTNAEYTNYATITSMCNTLISTIFSSLTPSIGNLSVGNAEARKYDVYMQIHYLCFFFIGMVTVGFITLATPFVALWLGPNYLLEQNVVIALASNFYLHGCQYSSSAYRNAYGIFWQGKFRPLAMGVCNIVLSVAFVLWTSELSSVFWATVISRLLTTFWYDPYLIHKHGLKRSSKPYFIRYAFYVVLVIVAAVAAGIICRRMPTADTVVSLVFKGIACVGITGLIFICATFWMPEFKANISTIKRVLSKLRKK